MGHFIVRHIGFCDGFRIPLVQSFQNQGTIANFFKSLHSIMHLTFDLIWSFIIPIFCLNFD